MVSPARVMVMDAVPVAAPAVVITMVTLTAAAVDDDAKVKEGPPQTVFAMSTTFPKK